MFSTLALAYFQNKNHIYFHHNKQLVGGMSDEVLIPDSFPPFGEIEIHHRIFVSFEVGSIENMKCWDCQRSSQSIDESQSLQVMCDNQHTQKSLSPSMVCRYFLWNREMRPPSLNISPSLSSRFFCYIFQFICLKVKTKNIYYYFHKAFG